MKLKTEEAEALLGYYPIIEEWLMDEAAQLELEKSELSEYPMDAQVFLEKICNLICDGGTLEIIDYEMESFLFYEDMLTWMLNDFAEYLLKEDNMESYQKVRNAINAIEKICVYFNEDAKEVA